MSSTQQRHAITKGGSQIATAIVEGEGGLAPTSGELSEIHQAN